LFYELLYKRRHQWPTATDLSPATSLRSGRDHRH